MVVPYKDGLEVQSESKEMIGDTKLSNISR